MTIRDIWNNMLWRLIAFNVAIFLIVNLVVLCGVPQTFILEHLALPANPTLGVTHIYTVLAYMFTQVQIVHLLFNMLWMWGFGTIMMRYGVSERVVANAYLFGGFAGAACFMILGAMHLADGVLIGSSAAILAIMAACGILLARHSVQLVLFGSVQVRWLSLSVIAFTIIIDATSAGHGHIGAHLAGAVAGVIYALFLQRKQHQLKNIAKHYQGAKRSYSAVRRPAQHGLDATEQAELDALLAKVKKSGHSALSSADKTRLFQLSNKIK